MIRLPTSFLAELLILGWYNVHIPHIGREVVGMCTRFLRDDPTICHWCGLGLFPEVGEGDLSITLD